MISPAQIWRIVKDVDLEGITRAANERVDLVVASDTGEDADAFRGWLSGEAWPSPPESGHPWLRRFAARDGMPALGAAPAAAVLVSSRPDFTAALAALREHLAKNKVPVVAVVVGDSSREARARREHEWSRAAVESLDDGAGTAVATALLAAVPRERHVALAREFPPLRPIVSLSLVDETARANAGFAFTTGVAETVPVLSAPLAVGDMVVLTKNQLLMCYRIVLAHGRNGDPRTLIGEIVGVLGSGLLLRQAARQLVGLIPVLGLVPKVAIAYAGTWAVGRAMLLWASQGRDVTRDAVRRYSREGLARGRLVARAMYEKGHDGVTRVSSARRARHARTDPAEEP
jgi:uncharacterized protein (DUF697 family)